MYLLLAVNAYGRAGFYLFCAHTMWPDKLYYAIRKMATLDNTAIDQKTSLHGSDNATPLKNSRSEFRKGHDHIPQRVLKVTNVM